jgi:hypothetical protein
VTQGLLIAGGYGEVGRQVATELAPRYPGRVIYSTWAAYKDTPTNDREAAGVSPGESDDRTLVFVRSFPETSTRFAPRPLHQDRP